MYSTRNHIAKFKFGSLSTNFAWILTGNIAYALCQFGVLVLIAKCGTAEMVGKFTLSIAIATPVFMMTNLGLRPIYVTDSIRKYEPSEYLSLRIGSSTFGLLVLLIVTLFGGYDNSVALVLISVTIYKFSESISNLLHGAFQKNERMDLICKSLISRGILSLLCLYVLLKVYDSIVVATFGMAIAGFSVMVSFDLVLFTKIEIKEINWRTFFNYRNSMDLIKTSYMVGFVALLVSLRSSIPKYFIEHEKGLETLGYFSALAYVVTACTMLSEALGQTVVSRLSKYYVESPKNFIKLANRSIYIGCVIGFCLIFSSTLLGNKVLIVLFSEEYSRFHSLLIWLSLSGCMSIVGSVFYYVMISAGRYKFPGFQQMGMVIVTTLAALVLIPKYGLMGGAYCLIASAIIHVAGGFLVFLSITKNLKVKNAE